MIPTYLVLLVVVVVEELLCVFKLPTTPVLPSDVRESHYITYYIPPLQPLIPPTISFSPTFGGQLGGLQ